ncbi:MAG: sensor histidine kinase, partial [Pseudomonadota bacterium]
MDAPPASAPATDAFRSSLLEASGEPVLRWPSLDAGRVFNVCHVGVVLRALLLLHGVLAVGVMFGAASFTAWLT